MPSDDSVREYARLMMSGFPCGTVSRFKSSIKRQAKELGVEFDVLMDSIRAQAIDIIRLQSTS